jgi:hypothetical protein
MKLSISRSCGREQRIESSFLRLRRRRQTPTDEHVHRRAPAGAAADCSTPHAASRTGANGMANLAAFRALVVEPKNSATSWLLSGMTGVVQMGRERLLSGSSRPDRRPRRAQTYDGCSVRRAACKSSISDANFGLQPSQRRARMPAGRAIMRGALACFGRLSRMREVMDPRVAR